MWSELLTSWRVTPPAIWGKLPGHADFVRGGARHGEPEAWGQWLAQQSPDAGADATAKAVAVPVAFVLPPGTLAFARRRFVLGVIAPSVDKVGRYHPLLVYQQAHPGWVQRHFEAQPLQPMDWQFWLARAVARHTRVQEPSDMHALQLTVQALWRVLMASASDPGRGRAEAHRRQIRALLDRRAGLAPEHDLAARLHGVRYLPWADWPQRLQGPRAESLFWQQDAMGRFVGAANALQRLWSASP